MEVDIHCDDVSDEMPGAWVGGEPLLEVRTLVAGDSARIELSVSRSLRVRKMLH